ncbi:hypothetical protein DY000_02024467 [Brassica cretica]|uniref:Uncharacterized protein n=1 Tax=Brassica cretica TaxID=69181 RepID=A0ABQ7E257_BRACR|nr:hypothetical protein DY000_02024467 [Brassica cretica]
MNLELGRTDASWTRADRSEIVGCELVLQECEMAENVGRKLAENVGRELAENVGRELAELRRERGTPRVRVRRMRRLGLGFIGF